MSIFVVLPNQLFERSKKDLSKFDKYILWEHPHYFKTYKYNKKKLLLHRASMKCYYDYLKKKGCDCTYVDFNNKFDTKEYTLYDPIDDLKLPNKFTMIETPNFLLTKEIYEEYRKKTDKFFFNSFYMWGKKRIDVLPDVKSQDKYNRSKLPKGVEIPGVASNSADKKYIDEAKLYVEKHFKNNYGNVENFMFPVCHKTAKKFINHFIKHKIDNFGKYQDSVVKDEKFLFHSLLSSSINIGLINPRDLIDIIIDSKSKINNTEGFIRQLFWREYQRFCHLYYNFNNKNYFGNKKKLTKDWYNGTTKIDPIDTCIKNGFETGYLHHIERLMVVGNYMNLCKIHPMEGFKWFMEFSCDSYEWVMKQNVLDMVFFCFWWSHYA